MAQSRGRRPPRLGHSKRPPETDTACEDFLASLYCIYFTPLSMIVRCWACIVPVLCVYCRVFVLGHTVYTAPFSHVNARKHMLPASVAVADRRT